MPKLHIKPKSKAMRNLHSSAKGIAKSTGNTAAKGVEKTAKWMATDHAGSVEDIKLMQSQQRNGILFARSDLIIRTME